MVTFQKTIVFTLWISITTTYASSAPISPYMHSQTPAQDRIFIKPIKQFPIWGMPYGLISKGAVIPPFYGMFGNPWAQMLAQPTTKASAPPQPPAPAPSTAPDDSYEYVYVKRKPRKKKSHRPTPTYIRCTCPSYEEDTDEPYENDYDNAVPCKCPAYKPKEFSNPIRRPKPAKAYRGRPKSTKNPSESDYKKPCKYNSGPNGGCKQSQSYPIVEDETGGCKRKNRGKCVKYKSEPMAQYEEDEEDEEEYVDEIVAQPPQYIPIYVPYPSFIPPTSASSTIMDQRHIPTMGTASQGHYVTPLSPLSPSSQYNEGKRQMQLTPQSQLQVHYQNQPQSYSSHYQVFSSVSDTEPQPYQQQYQPYPAPINSQFQSQPQSPPNFQSQEIGAPQQLIIQYTAVPSSNEREHGMEYASPNMQPHVIHYQPISLNQMSLNQGPHNRSPYPEFQNVVEQKRTNEELLSSGSSVFSIAYQAQQTPQSQIPMQLFYKPASLSSPNVLLRQREEGQFHHVPFTLPLFLQPSQISQKPVDSMDRERNLRVMNSEDQFIANHLNNYTATNMQISKQYEGANGKWNGKSNTTARHNGTKEKDKVPPSSTTISVSTSISDS